MANLTKVTRYKEPKQCLIPIQGLSTLLYHYAS